MKRPRTQEQRNPENLLNKNTLSGLYMGITIQKQRAGILYRSLFYAQGVRKEVCRFAARTPRGGQGK